MCLILFDTEFIVPDFPLAAKYVLLQTQTFAGNTNLTKDSKIYKSPDPKHKFVTYTEKFSQSNYLKKLNRVVCREYGLPRVDKEI